MKAMDAVSQNVPEKERRWVRVGETDVGGKKALGPSLPVGWGAGLWGTGGAL